MTRPHDDGDARSPGPRAGSRPARERLCAATGEVNAGRRHDPLRASPRMARSCPISSGGCPAAASGSPRPGQALAQRASPARRSPAASSARSAVRRRSRRIDRAAARACGARCARHGPQGQAGRDRLRQGRGGACRRGPGRRPACHGSDAGRTACASSMPALRQRPDAENIVIIDTFAIGAIGFGIRAVKCGTCSPACRSRKREHFWRA